MPHMQRGEKVVVRKFQNKLSSQTPTLLTLLTGSGTSISRMSSL